MGTDTHGLTDKPLSFHWRSADFDDSGLGLSPTRSRRQARARHAIILDLIIEAQGDDRQISYSRNRSWWSETRRYRGGDYSYSTVVSSVDQLDEAGLVDHWKAPQRRPHISPTGEHLQGRQSTLRAADRLRLAVAPMALTYEVGETVRLRDSQKCLKGYRDTNQTIRFRRALSEINDALRETAICLSGVEVVESNRLKVATRNGKSVSVCTLHNQLFRVFNGDWTHGGRLYGGWWQQLPKEARAKLLINGESVTEPDYPSHHPRILYELTGKPLVGDPYDIQGFARPLAKLALNVMLNAANQRQALYAIAREVERIDRGHDYNGNISQTSLSVSSRLFAVLKARHSRIARHFATGIGTHLQYLDSLMAERVSLAILRRHSVAVLPVHDSFVVPHPLAGATRDVMDQAFAEVMLKAAA